MNLSQVVGLIKGTPRKNILRDYTPVCSVFAFDPTSLGNISDGDITTVTGYGTKTTSGAADCGILTYNFGSAKKLIVAVKIGAYSNTGTIYLYIEQSDNGSTWKGCNGGRYAAAIGNSSEVIQISDPAYVAAQYLRFRFRASAAADCSVRIYTATATESD